MVVLNNRNIVINVNTRLCTSCDTNNCLHFEAFYECSKNNCLLVCEPNILDKVTNYTPNPHNIFLIEDKIIHNFYISSGICICSSCHSKCKKQSILQLILEKIGYSASIGNPKDIDYETITTLKIPLISTKAESLTNIFKEMHTLECLIMSINLETSTGILTLHPTISPLLKCILTKIECLFKNPSRQLV